MNLFKYFLTFSLLFNISCNTNINQESDSREIPKQPEDSLPSVKNKISVLNFGTFHMGSTTDANTTEFDERDRNNQKKVHEIASELAKFDPTVILVEMPPEYNDQLEEAYKEYLSNPEMVFENPSEIELLAFEVGRLAKTKRIYGIDHKLSYNYNIGSNINNSIDSTWYNKVYSNPYEYFPELKSDNDSISLKEKLIQNNTQSYYNLMISLNADMLTHAGSENNFEGADEAAKFYQRNLRMYSNLNRIDLNQDDRVFILMGTAHTAFFQDFLSRSPKYELVNTFDYLN
jgi:hypothetical protein